MKISKLLNKKYFSIILILLFGMSANAEDKPVDIWNIDKKEIEENSTKDEEVISQNKIEINENLDTNIINMQSGKENSTINLEEELETQEIKIIGLYDPEDNGLDIDMWSSSDGDQIKSILKKLNSMNLSKDAIEIVNISLLTNAYRPQKKHFRKRIFKI